jgi:hypothetical protein
VALTLHEGERRELTQGGSYLILQSIEAIIYERAEPIIPRKCDGREKVSSKSPN